MRNKLSASYLLKFSLFFAFILVILSFCSACGNKELGMNAAYEALQKLSEKKEFSSHLYSSYNADEDKLIIELDSEVDLKKFFKVLNESVDGSAMGNIVFANHGLSKFSDEFAKEFGIGLSELSCLSIKSLTISDEYLTDESWTGILDRTESMQKPNLELMTSYSSIGMSNLAQLKKAIIYRENGSYQLKNIELLSGIEEIIMSAGMTESEQAETLGELKRSYSVDKGTTVVNQGVVSGGINQYQRFENLDHLKRVIIYPEISGWQPDNDWCMGIMSLQMYAPDVYINKPGEVWSGNESDLLAVNNMNPMDYTTGSRVVEYAIDSCYCAMAKSYYERGQNFAYSSDAPVLRGTYLIYTATPKMVDKNQQYEGFCTNSPKILQDDNLSTPKSLVEEITMFVYVYPEYSLAGKYSDGSKAYATIANVKIFDLKKRIQYESFVADIANPLDMVYTDGSRVVNITAIMNYDNVLDFLKKLQLD